MPATASRISFVGQQYRTYVAANAAIKTRYGLLARDTLDAPPESFFDTISDVQAICDERFNLLKGDRRKFQISVSGLLSFTGALDFSQTAPAVTVLDDEKNASLAAAIVSIVGKDYDSNKTTVICWG
jgi:hypothetical protein